MNETGGDPDMVSGCAVCAEHLALAQRIQAEFANYKKRSTNEQNVAGEHAVGAFITALLDVVDALDAAVSYHVDGVGSIRDTLVATLTRAGVERIEPIGAAFDPATCEAVEVRGDGEVVVEVLRAGYQMNGRTLRAASVVVGTVQS